MASNQTYSKICSHCGADFTAQKITTQFCSHQCSRKAYKQRRQNERTAENEKRERNKTLPPILQQEKSQQIKPSDNNLSTLKQKEYLSIADVAMLFSTSRSTIHRYCVSGKLKCIRMNRKIIIRRRDIDELFDFAPKYEVSPRKQKRKPKRVEPPIISEEITDLLTAEEASTKYGVTKDAIHRYAKKNSVPWILFQGRRKYSRKHLEEHYQEANQYPHITEWYYVEEIMEMYAMKKHSVYSLVSENDVPRKNVKGKTIYSKSHIDELLKSRLCNDFEDIEVWYSKEDLYEL